MDENGRNAKTLTAPDLGQPASPSWSPDGKSIALGLHVDDNSDIYVINADGSGLVRLTQDPAWDGDPSWSPDGTRIAFSSGRDNDFGTDIYVMDANGDNVQRLTHTGNCESPAWSPIVETRQERDQP
jgi:TolB protein